MPLPPAAPIELTEPLSDGVVVVRHWGPGDVAAITRICQDPEIARWTRVPSPYSEDDARDFLRMAEASSAGATGLHLAVDDARSDELIGAVGLVGIDRGNEVAEIGYHVAAEARRRGVATRAVGLLSRWALTDLVLARIELMTDVANRPSQRVAERAGFTREGVLRSYREIKGRRLDLVMFSLVQEDLAAGEGDDERRGGSAVDPEPATAANMTEEAT